MLRLAVRGALMLSVAVIVLVILAKGIGIALPPTGALAGLGRCGDAPCWYGIMVGTPLENALIILVAQGYQEVGGQQGYRMFVAAGRCTIGLRSTENSVSQIILERCDGATLGDVLSVLGDPLGVTIERTGAVRLELDDAAYYYAFFADGQWITLRDPIGTLAFPPSTPASRIYDWAGFVSGRLTCQRVPDFALCEPR